MRRLILLLTVMAMTLVVTRPALAAPFAVDRNDDPDPTTVSACSAAADDCSLRGAIVAANAAAGADTITVPAGTYTLTRDGANEDAASTGDLDVTEDLTIIGTGARATSVLGGAAPFDDRIFEFRPGFSEEPAVTATIIGLTITGGKAGGGGGGGVKNRGDLTLERVAVKGNTSNPDGIGGGIFVDGARLSSSTAPCPATRQPRSAAFCSKAVPPTSRTAPSMATVRPQSSSVAASPAYRAPLCTS
jgi:trimeric autotransporter adhesin